MSELSNKTVLIWDQGADYVHIAEAIAPEFGNVFYYVPWESSFSTAKGLLPGIGLEGVERCPDFFEHLDNADLVVFCDVGNYGLQEWLRQQGKPVFGSGMGGKYETDRLLLKQLCAEAGIDVAEYAPVQGMKALRKLLEKSEDLWIKLSYFRGEGETRKHVSWKHSRKWFNRLEANLGPYADMADFLIEVPIQDDDGPCVEIGFDSYCADGVFPDTMFFGYECKDAAFVGRVGSLPERMASVRDKLAPALGRVGYRGPLSTETRECESGSYLIDLTCRFPSPPSELQSKLIANLGQVFWDVAHGIKPRPDYRYRYGAQIVLKSQEFQEGSIALDIDRPDRVAIHGHCKIDGQDYAVSVSEIEEMAGACGMADTMEDAIREAYEVAEGVSGADVKYDTGALHKALETIQQGELLGLTWGEQEERDGGEERAI